MDLNKDQYPALRTMVRAITLSAGPAITRFDLLPARALIESRSGSLLICGPVLVKLLDFTGASC
jgi:hypothetical protein